MPNMGEGSPGMGSPSGEAVPADPNMGSPAMPLDASGLPMMPPQEPEGSHVRIERDKTKVGFTVKLQLTPQDLQAFRNVAVVMVNALKAQVDGGPDGSRQHRLAAAAPAVAGADSFLLPRIVRAS